MARGYVPLLLLLSALWGASYMFIKVGVEEMEPTTMTALRAVLAAALLVAFLATRIGARAALAELRATGRGALVMGVLNAALPFTLIAWGEKHVDSGIAAIANASVPIFVALLALRFSPAERVTGLRLAGVVLGLVGVAVLTGLNPEGGWWAVAGILAVIVASLSYAAANLYVQHRFETTSPLVVAAATTLVAGAVLLPPGIAQAPHHLPSLKAIGAVVALSVLGTVVASLVLYRMIVAYGASRTTLVSYLLPAFALLYGVTLLGEPVSAGALLGLALILGGVALGSGLVRFARSETVPAA